MNRIRYRLFTVGRQSHTLSHDVPTETLKRKVAELEKTRKMKTPKKKDRLFVEVPESKSYLDTASMPMILTAVGIALFAKLVMMYDESRSQELIERKIKNAPAGQGTVRMLTREEWEEIREVRPRTPFESKLARPNARLRTGDTFHTEDLKDWTIDVLTDAVTRAEECIRHRP
ncbi:Cytoplasmic dynein 2 light intermediate chain [Quillaja saponaria]|uniref:Cytoplasmic dynein 2 light intermediate chain n=1 Tax=Quillaja saponaria TaxID=32244 RepID=A0AAD7KTT5_QUISA|nr:Cytoplasmic dynein 2 light intermediate chain [Quillaja saponaria]